MACSGGIVTFDPANYDEHTLRARRFSVAAAAAGTSGLNAAIAATDWTDYVAAMHVDVPGWSLEMWKGLGKINQTLYTDHRNPPATKCYQWSEAGLYSLYPLLQTFPTIDLYGASGADLTVQLNANLVVQSAPTGDFLKWRVCHAGLFAATRWGQSALWTTLALQFYAPWEGVVPFASIQ